MNNQKATVIITFHPHLNKEDLIIKGVTGNSHDDMFYNLDRGMKGSIAISKNEILSAEMKFGEEDE